MYRYGRYKIIDRTDRLKTVDIIDAVNGKEALKQFMRNHALTQFLYRIEKVESVWFLRDNYDYGSCFSAHIVCEVSGKLIDSVRREGAQTIVSGGIGERRYDRTEKFAKRAYLQEYLNHVLIMMPESHRPVIDKRYL